MGITQGDWYVAHVSDDWPTEIRSHGAAGVVAATTTIDDARLIAAAPRLLELLGEAVDCDRQPCTCYDDASDGCWICEAAVVVNAATGHGPND